MTQVKPASLKMAQELGRSQTSRQSSVLPAGPVSASENTGLSLKAAVPRGSPDPGHWVVGSGRKDRAIPAG